MKIAICTPCYGNVTAEYSYSLAKLLIRSAQTQIEFNGHVVYPAFEVFMRTSSVLPQLRNMLVRDATDWGANYLLWIDADHKFPDDALLRLLSLNLSVVGTNYPRRVPPYLPTATGLDGELIETNEDVAKAGNVVAVASVGLGFCLIDMTIFEQLNQHALTSGKNGDSPFFAVEMIGDGTAIVGEDVFFFNRLRAAGIATYVDQALSWNIGHVHERVLTNADAQPTQPRKQRATIKISYGSRDE